jgi:purine-binding chemotaxis protein CheW
MEYVKGLVKFADGMIFIHDLDAFLSLEEESALEKAIGEVDATEFREI